MCFKDFVQKFSLYQEGSNRLYFIGPKYNIKRQEPLTYEKISVQNLFSTLCQNNSDTDIFTCLFAIAISR